MTASEDPDMAAATMDSFCITLEARSSAHRCHRAYEIAVTKDLFGAWLVHMSYGRIGTQGRTKARSFLTQHEAAAQVSACLQKRAGAPRRIGVAYHVRRAVCGKAWYQPDLDEQLCSWFSVAAGSLPDRNRYSAKDERGQRPRPRSIAKLGCRDDLLPGG